MISATLLACLLVTVPPSEMHLETDAALAELERLFDDTVNLGLRHPTTIMRKAKVERLMGENYEPNLLFAEERLQQLVSERADLSKKLGIRHPDTRHNARLVLFYSRVINDDLDGVFSELGIGN